MLNEKILFYLICALLIINLRAQEKILISETDSIKLYETFVSVSATENIFPTFYSEGFIYLSSHKTKDYKLYYSDLKSKSIKIKTGSKFDFGSVTIFNNEIYFTGKSKSLGFDGTHNLTIYKGTLENFKVTNIDKLSICSKDYTYAHPSISKDGRYMVIVTNENGIFHLLNLTRNKDNEWGKGEVIYIAQTNFMLLNPSIYDENTIYFSSNIFYGHVKELKNNYKNGELMFTEIYREQGDFNIYKISKANGKWQLPEKTKVFNSEFDDLGVIFKTEASGYLTTYRYDNRDNIYYFELK